LKIDNYKYESARVRKYESEPTRSPRTHAPSHSRTGWRRRLRGVALAGVMAVGGTGCTDLAMYDLDILLGYVPFFSYMRWSVSPAPYEMPRLPAEGSIPAVNPRGDVPPAFTQLDLTQGAGEVVGLQSPLEPTAAVLARGQQMYTQHCYACHGPQGLGDGPVIGAGKFPYALPTNAAAVARFSDGYLYGIIRVGRGLMPAYGDRMTHLDRWALVHYLRALGAQPGIAVPPGAPIAPTDPTAPGTTPGAAPGTTPQAPGTR
jgi:mono/diheme cytochrome c family protein